jgi:biopolymer transport protein ExbD
MKRLFGRQAPSVPELNTSSLPDLIFTVLFFFMIVTHMRKVTLKVKYQVPAGTELTRLTKKSAVSYIYIGEREQASGDTSGRMFIQMNDKLVTIPEVMDYVTAERNRMSPADAQAMTVSIKADRRTDMGTVTDVKQALRRVGALRINYSAVKPPKKQ